ncbi:hypothetical protein M9H77_24174 [Catharanthus roseus]|uniref:Uncharacterized protein n=1 Tax=Catharanthus roseus TaxID=4058 RepID=A0ACC0AWC0_CATRO|nr:hypothetical protein M9H77_24174 [Catharanthus roseus]
MGGETTAETWFSNLWRTSRKSNVSVPERGIIGVLTFEIVSLMSKLVNVWHCLEDEQVVRLKEEIVNSPGIQTFISEDNDYLMELAFAEIMENVGYVARAVVILGKRCADPMYHNLKKVFYDPIEIDLNWCGWEYRLKKMERKVKKMEKFVAATAQLYQELEVLAELEQSLRRVKANPDSSQVKLLEFQQKVLWQRQEVKNLREMSPWIRTHDYIVRLLLRSIFTIIERMKHVIGRNQGRAVEEGYDLEYSSDKVLVRSNSVATFMQSSVHPSDNKLFKFRPGHLGRSFSNLSLSHDRNRSSFRKASKSRMFAHVGPFKGCMTGTDSPVLQSFTPSSSDVLKSDGLSCTDTVTMKSMNIQPVSSSTMSTTRIFLFNFKHSLLTSPPSTLGSAALSLHYANIIILIEKLVSSPHLISLDARDDLYNMLTASIRSSLRAKLKVFSKTAASSVYDAALAAEWRLALSRILEWLSPLAHNMIKWHSERSFERQHMTPGASVLLVQTLYFANQIKTEAAVTELLMGLNYLSRFYKELSERPFPDSSCRRASDAYPFHKDNVSQSMINHMS